MFHTPEGFETLVADRQARLDRPQRRWRRDIADDTMAAAKQERQDMDTTSALARFEASLADQLALAGGDPAVETAARTLQAALGPAARQLAFDLAQQAATEVDAQLPEHSVEVVLDDGEPTLAVRAQDPPPPSGGDEDYEARITLRLPPSLKGRLEAAARMTGDSVNAWVVDALSGAASRRESGRPGRRVRGTVQT